MIYYGLISLFTNNYTNILISLKDIIILYVTNTTEHNYPGNQI